MKKEFHYDNGRHCDIVDSLRGKIVVPITDGMGPVGEEEDAVMRMFPASKLALDSATYIEFLRDAIKQRQLRAQVQLNEVYSLMNELGDPYNGSLKDADKSVHNALKQLKTLEALLKAELE